MSESDLEQRGINVIRGLAMDAPQRANAGHPGTAMALAPLAHVLWTRIMKYDPSDPEWPDRDRFVLSCGHACILLYSMLYLTGYGLELSDLESFRQVHSRCAGHPEVDHSLGIEVTTGPLGQGVANGVGLGIAERMLRSQYSPDLVDHHTFVICSDGDLMEGISHEVASLAGHLGLGRLIYIYDDNHITIDGPTEITLDDDPAKRFEAYGWHVEELGEIANDTDALEAAIRRAMAVEDKPSFLVLRSHIAYPAPHATDTSAAHGSPLGVDEVKATKEIMGLPVDQEFYVPDDVLSMYREAIPKGQAIRAEWDKRLAAWDGDREVWDAQWRNQALPGFTDLLPKWEKVGESVPTRVSINKTLNAIAPKVPGLSSGGADLTGNTGTKLNDAERQSKEHPGGRAIAYGVREHGMAGIMTGLSEHGGIIPVGGTFFVFSDYMRGAVRVASLSEAKVIYFWTHDSIGLGEDGPTHQPIEQLAAMRAMPNIRIIRPADANESAHALRVAIERTGPTGLILSRQGIPVLEGTLEHGAELEKGAYVLVEGDDDPDIVLIGTGSEVHLCVEAAQLLAADGLSARVVSMPSWELFDEQDEDYQDRILGPGAPILSVEAAASFGWARWADDSVSLDRFGLSGPGGQVMAELGFTAEHVAERARALIDDLDGFDLDESEDFDDKEDA
jgi:transketolase